LLCSVAVFHMAAQDFALLTPELYKNIKSLIHFNNNFKVWYVNALILFFFMQNVRRISRSDAEALLEQHGKYVYILNKFLSVLM